MFMEMFTKLYFYCCVVVDILESILFELFGFSCAEVERNEIFSDVDWENWLSILDRENLFQWVFRLKFLNRVCIETFLIRLMAISGHIVPADVLFGEGWR
jgi:hypothetical protein